MNENVEREGKQFQVIKNARVDVEICGDRGETLYTIICHPGDPFIVLKPGDGGNDTPMGLSVGADEILGVIAALHQARDIMAAGVESENIL